jgi:hypothetical protein
MILEPQTASAQDRDGAPVVLRAWRAARGFSILRVSRWAGGRCRAAS